MTTKKLRHPDYVSHYGESQRIDGVSKACLIARMMTRLARLVFLIAIGFMALPVQAKEAACCASGKTAKKTMCADYAKLNLSAEQNTKLAALQEKCMKDGCTEQSRAKFLKSAQKILSADQYAQLKAECAKTEKKQS